MRLLALILLLWSLPLRPQGPPGAEGGQLPPPWPPSSQVFRRLELEREQRKWEEARRKAGLPTPGDIFEDWRHQQELKRVVEAINHYIALYNQGKLDVRALKEAKKAAHKWAEGECRK